MKLYEPPYFCAYRGTDGLSRYESLKEGSISVGARLRKMRNMYTRFRPHQRELEANGKRVVARKGDIPGSRTYPGTVQDKHRGETVKQTLNLEAHELFTQLIAQTNLVKIGPRNGLFTCFVDVEEGVIRVWRDWLGKMAARNYRDDNSASKSTVAAEEMTEAKADLEDDGILWVSSSKLTGIRFNVKEKKFRRDVPILIRANEDVPVSYEIEYDGEYCYRTFRQKLTNPRASYTNLPSAFYP